ncbi:hypothetical protein [Nocardioides mesophilus]|uniref:Cell wall protein n=1 Tax=Nocardioides mesophilus TaxID=433659 RepID=A0A7G9R8B6_9ACTN|nr:hypothetical protein [Nocardioides mesophilus]QNN51841.1 hypothetical protein H9L09_15020 [Nocardioides mesophilus]
MRTLPQMTVGAATLALAATVTPAVASPRDDLQLTRAATARFHSLGQATSSGYGELRDAAGIACIDNPAGGMGIHYVNGALVGDPSLTPGSPEVLVYQPAADGSLHLVALEYVILESTWRATHPDPADVPRLFGQSFERLAGPGEAQPQNRYGLPAFYELHLWLWKPNPSGMFHDWNPDVTCP